jgi:Flp pilus assembly pilin Flp
MEKLLKKLTCQKGQGTVEYALVTLAVVLIVAAVLLGANPSLKTAITGAFTAASDAITNATP